MNSEGVTVVCPINIALVKYWGKRDKERMIPLNDSISVTVDALVAKTRVKICHDASDHKIRLNGVQLDIHSFPRVDQCIKAFQNLLKSKGQPIDWFCEVDSETNFPVGAGLASSAAGYAAMTFALSLIFKVDALDACSISRFGSGSACRSIPGGWVHWFAGEEEDGSDCRCEQISGTQHWPTMRAVVIVVSDSPKETGSTECMEITVQTSELLRRRVDYSVPKRIEHIRKAILERDFPTFGEEVMKESNQMHAVCLDSYPPLFLMNDASRHIVRLVHAFNRILGRISVAYTFDAGPNAVLLLEEKTLPEFLPYLCHYCPNNTEEKFIRGAGEKIDRELASHKEPLNIPILKEAVQYVIVSKVSGTPYKV